MELHKEDKFKIKVLQFINKQRNHAPIMNALNTWFKNFFTILSTII
jgi:hypothetical protein